MTIGNDIAGSQSLLVHSIDSSDVFVVSIEDVGKEEEGPSNEHNWEENHSSLDSKDGSSQSSLAVKFTAKSGNPPGAGKI